MQFRVFCRLLLPIVLCTAASVAAQTPAGSDGRCRQIAGQLPHAASTFEHDLAAAPRNAVRWSNRRSELPIAAATGLLIASGDQHINNHIESPSFVQAATVVSNVGLGIELSQARRG